MRAFLKRQKYEWSSRIIHSVKADVLRKNDSIREFIDDGGNGGGPRPTGDEQWEKQYNEFKRIKREKQLHRNAPPHMYTADECLAYDVLNEWYYQQLLGTSRCTIEKERENRLAEVYSDWVNIAKQRIRNNIFSAPRSLTQANFEANICGGCGEKHNWLDVVYMCCYKCSEWYDTRPSCIGKSREDAMRLKNGSVEMNVPGREVIIGDTWTCSFCEQAEVEPDEEIMEDEAAMI